jgi:hypothetical protein
LEGNSLNDATIDKNILQGRTLGSVGMGNIASELFRMARGVGFGRLLSFDPYGSPQQAAELCRQLLAYAGKGQFSVEAVDLSQLALEMSNLLEATLPIRARVLGQFPPGLPAVEGDPTQVRQVVMNLVLNAAEALPDGNGVIRLATGIVHLAAEELAGLILGAELAAGKYVYFEVCDTGYGMAEDARARIFDPFYTRKTVPAPGSLWTCIAPRCPRAIPCTAATPRPHPLSFVVQNGSKILARYSLSRSAISACLRS